MTQTVKLIEPKLLDDQGKPMEFLIDPAYEEAPSDAAPDEVTLDGPG